MTASRYVYMPNRNKVGVILKKIEFDWAGGFALSQKQKNINSLHENAKLLGIEPILEISSKSPDILGQQLSAFNLSFITKNKKRIFVETAFQCSKVFDNGGLYDDKELYLKHPSDVRKEIKERGTGNVIGFNFLGEIFDAKPRTFFYDWLYINALKQNKNLLQQILNYNGFTDIEFNPVKSINCQAYSAALAVSLVENNVIENILDKNEFKKIMSEEYLAKDSERVIQQKMSL